MAAAGRRRGSGARRYPRAARVNELVREVVAESLERLSELEEAPGLLTVTGVECDPDLRHAVVLFASLGEAEHEALLRVRVRLQRSISTQVRLKRTPQLSFAADPAVAAGRRVEEVLRSLERGSEEP